MAFPLYVCRLHKVIIDVEKNNPNIKMAFKVITSHAIHTFIINNVYIRQSEYNRVS